MKLSVAIATYNEEKKLGACLASVSSWADEIVVVDGGSTDYTLTIARKYNARIIKTDNPPIFHINKQKALEACKGDWILQLDADEVVTPELKNEIIGTINNKQETIHGYYIPRKNYFWGHWMRKGGQYPDYVIRLVQNGKASFPAKSVHEQIAVQGEVGYLKEAMEHISYSTKEDYWKKAERYTTLQAMEMKSHRLPITVGLWFTYNVVKPVAAFISLFIFHKGFVDGWYGLIFAYWSALHHAIAYAKYRKLINKT